METYYKSTQIYPQNDDKETNLNVNFLFVHYYSQMAQPKTCYSQVKLDVMFMILIDNGCSPAAITE